jgi:hypothetical protein
MKVHLNCARCGDNSISLDLGLIEDCPVRCAACGHEVGTTVQLKEDLARAIIRRAAAGREPLAKATMAADLVRRAGAQTPRSALGFHPKMESLI